MQMEMRIKNMSPSLPRYFPDFIRPSQGVGARGLWALGLEGSEGV